MTAITRALVDRALATASDTRHLSVTSEPLSPLASTVAAFRDAFRSTFPASGGAVVVADPTTLRVAGQRIDAVLRSAGLAHRQPIVLTGPDPGSSPYAEEEQVRALMERLVDDEGTPVAVGSGTINDLTKLAAHRLGRPYMVVATAASMDGYAAFGASITRDGFKQTMACNAPAAIVAELPTLAAAPTPLTASGYGDLLGKVTAGADWLVADALECEPIDAFAWSLVQDPLRSALGSPEWLAQHDEAATEQFFLGLVISGLAMQATQTSRPASGAEHLISHLWEMTWSARGGAAPAPSHGPSPAPSHGAKVGIGTVLVTMLYERLVQHDLTQVDAEARIAALPSPEIVERAVRAALPAGEVADRAVAESLAKHPTPDQLRARLRLLRERWPVLREKIQVQLLPSSELRRMLRTLGAAASPAEIGVTPARLRADLLAARTIRRRYTVLDLAAEIGLLEPLADEIVAVLAADSRMASPDPGAGQ